MTSEATYSRDYQTIKHVAESVLVSGQVIQLADGRAGYNTALRTIAIGEMVAIQVKGIAELIKTTGIVILDGGDVFYDVSANKAHFRPEAGTPDFLIGTAVGDYASSAATVLVNLNEFGRYIIDLEKGGEWVSEETLGLGVVLLPGGGAKIAFDAVAEVAQGAIYSVHSVPISAGIILEGRVAVFDKGDAAAVDIDFGLANASHATDFEAVANFVTVHFDGNALDIKVMSDDGTTDVAAADSTIDAVDDTYFEFWIDARDVTDVQVYVNGVDAVPGGTTLVLTAATNALKALAMMEKTSDDTTAEIRVSRLRVRTSGEGA